MPVVGDPTQLYLGRELLEVPESFVSLTNELFDFFVLPIEDPHHTPLEEKKSQAQSGQNEDSAKGERLAGLRGAACRCSLEKPPHHYPNSSEVDEEKSIAAQPTICNCRVGKSERSSGWCQGLQSPALDYKYSFRPATRTDLAFDCQKWKSSIVGSVSPWIVTDIPPTAQGLVDAHGRRVHDPLEAVWGHSSTDNEKRQQFCAEALSSQLQWAAHCSMLAVMCTVPLTGYLCPNYANAIRSYISRTVAAQVWLRLPLTFPQEDQNSPPPAATTNQTDGKSTASANEAFDRVTDPWQLWNHIRMICGHNQNVGVVLEFTSKLPNDPNELQRWVAEPVKAAIIPTSIFLKNSKGFPVLPKRHKAFLQRLFRYNVQVIIRDDSSPSQSSENCPTQPACIRPAAPISSSNSHDFPDLSAASAPNSAVVPVENNLAPGGTNNGSPAIRLIDGCRHFVACLFKSMPALSPEETYSSSYWDYLQSPLQPLQDNLESQTYETFEKDPVKYVQYEKAITAALKDRIKEGKKTHVIMVVGAGRGPLVAASLAALETAGIGREASSVYAVEKNVNAVITLRGRVENDPNPRWRHVDVVGCDMRSWSAPELADILVSELLGSFGDNELSPECLDGAQRFLQPDGICIPTRYISALEPVSTSKLWIDCKGLNNTASPTPNGCGTKALESTYVVQFHAFYPIAEERPKMCFEFIHPNWQIPDQTSNEHNNRYCELTFTPKTDALLHGFAGYFHCDLYKDIHISILPSTFSEGMFSWFPLYFPIVEPVYVSKGKKITLHIWRQNDSHKVWYEWCTTSPVLSKIHNAGGLCCPIGK